MSPDEKRMMRAQAPLSGGNTQATLDLEAQVRKHFHDGNPVVVVDGVKYVRLPDCDGCASMRFDKIKGQWFHDPKCTVAKRRT